MDVPMLRGQLWITKYRTEAVVPTTARIMRNRNNRQAAESLSQEHVWHCLRILKLVSFMEAFAKVPIVSWVKSDMLRPGFLQHSRMHGLRISARKKETRLQWQVVNFVLSFFFFFLCVFVCVLTFDYIRVKPPGHQRDPCFLLLITRYYPPHFSAALAPLPFPSFATTG